MSSNIFEHILELFSFLEQRKPIEYKSPKNDKEAFKQDAKEICNIESTNIQDLSFGLINKLANIYCIGPFEIIEKPIKELEPYIYNKNQTNEEIQSISESNKIFLNQLFMDKILEVKPNEN